MLTSDQIQAGDTSLSDTAIMQWLMLIRALPLYRDRPGLYPNLEEKLNALKTGVIAAGDVVKAKTLNAALAQIEAVGAGAESLGSSASAGVAWSRQDNRNEFVMDGLNALYPTPAQRPSSAVRTSSSGICSVHGSSLNVCASAGRGCCGAGGVKLIF